MWAGALPQLSSCGPIEASRRSWRRRGGASLPQLSSCGPIEAAGSVPAAALRRAPSFRNYQVAAPLKHGKTLWARAGYGLPQLSSCGPIEAMYAQAERGHWASLPQLSSCGPIEAFGLGAGAPGAATLPQLSSCGPIEAFVSASVNSPTSKPSATIKLRPH